MYWEKSVRFTWQPGDMVMLDNMLISHARDTYQGPRQICVAMGGMVKANEI